MDVKRKSRRNAIGGHFTAEEVEVAEALLGLCQFGGAWCPEWGGKRKRSGTAGGGANCSKKPLHASKSGSPISPLNITALSGSDADDHSPHPTLPPLSSPCRLSSTTQKSGQVVNPRRRVPKRKTHGELKETVNALHVENEKLKKDKRQLLKTHQALQDWNKHLKSELGRKQGPSLASMQAALDDPDLGHKTKTTTCFEETPILDGHGCSKIIADALPLDLSCKECCRNGRSMCQHSPDFSCHSEKDYSQSIKGDFPVGVENLNVPCKAWSGPVRSGFSNYMLLSMEKAAFSDEARKQGTEHLKAKNCWPLEDQ